MKSPTTTDLEHTSPLGTNSANWTELQITPDSEIETLRVLNVNFKGDLSAAASAPVTEIAILYFDHPGPPHDYISRFEGEAMPLINKKRTDGYLGIAFGETYEAISAGSHAQAIPAQFSSHTEQFSPQKGTAIVVIGGFESIQAHELIRADTEHFAKVAPLLVRNARAIEKSYVQFSSSRGSVTP